MSDRADSTPGVIIREIREEDLQGLAALEQVCFSDAWSEKLLRETLESSYDVSFAAYAADPSNGAELRTAVEDGMTGESSISGESSMSGEGGKPAGWCSIRVVGDEAELMRICVAEKLRGKGLGGQLLRRGMEEMLRRGAKAATLEVRSGNLPAKRLYEAHGFRQEGRRKDYYRDPSEDALIYWNRALKET